MLFALANFTKSGLDLNGISPLTTLLNDVTEFSKLISKISEEAVTFSTYLKGLSPELSTHPFFEQT